MKMLPSVKMTEIQEFVECIVADPDYNLDYYGLDVSAVIDTAVVEKLPEYYNKADQQNFELELRSQLEVLYDEHADTI